MLIQFCVSLAGQSNLIMHSYSLRVLHTGPSDQLSLAASASKLMNGLFGRRVFFTTDIEINDTANCTIRIIYILSGDKTGVW